MTRLLLLFCALPSFFLYAQPPNFNFEQRNAAGKPAGWNRFGAESGQLAVDSTIRHAGRYALRLSDNAKGDFIASDWRIPVTFEGKSITLTGYVKTEKTGQEPDAFAGLWLRVDGESGPIAFDNMQKRGLKGSTEWKAYTITLPLPENAITVHVGGLVSGTGTAWFDDFVLTVDGKPFDKAPVKVVKLAKAQTDTVFNQGSRIDLTTLTAQQIENLTVLGKVWGFVKYYHPSVADGNYNMDAELFRVMPSMLKATSMAERSGALLKWLSLFGSAPASRTKQPDTIKALHKPDLAWLTNDKLLSAPLRAQLETIRVSHRPDKHFYVSMAPQIGNPEFKHEAPYHQMKTPDAGYRLLALYRFWNIIQYFFPYKHLIGEDWNQVLPELIPKFVSANDSLSYRLASLALIGRIHDTHANLWGDRIIRNEYKGTYFAPVQVKFIENKFVVTNFYNDSLGKASGLLRGDVISSVDNVPTQTLIQQRQPYYPASNKPTQLRAISRDLLMGHTNTVKLDIDRDGKSQTLTLNRYKAGQVKFNDRIDYSSFPKDSCYQLLHPDVGYLFLGNIKADKLPQIMRLFKDTKGLVIDLRCYPSEFVVFSMGKYLTTPTPFAKFTGGSVQNPGLFSWIESVKVGQRGVDNAYKGKVIILVNEVTQSQAEYTTMAFRKAPGSIVLGSITAAADGNVSPFELPGGLQTMISGIGVNYPDGRETQRVGVGVDVEMHPTRKGIQEGRDELLEKAILLIRDER